MSTDLVGVNLTQMVELQRMFETRRRGRPTRHRPDRPRRQRRSGRLGPLQGRLADTFRAEWESVSCPTSASSPRACATRRSTSTRTAPQQPRAQRRRRLTMIGHPTPTPGVGCRQTTRPPTLSAGSSATPPAGPVPSPHGTRPGGAEKVMMRVVVLHARERPTRRSTCRSMGRRRRSSLVQRLPGIGVDADGIPVPLPPDPTRDVDGIAYPLDTPLEELPLVEGCTVASERGMRIFRPGAVRVLVWGGLAVGDGVVVGPGSIVIGADARSELLLADAGLAPQHARLDVDRNAVDAVPPRRCIGRRNRRPGRAG